MTRKKDFVLLIPYYNDLKGLIESINSIRYPADRYSLLIVDDGSEPPLETGEIVKQKPLVDINVLRLSQNQGIVKALNTGLKELQTHTEYKYIARLDCGDICHPDRFTEQVSFMDKHPDVALLGTWCSFSERESGRAYTYRTRIEHNDIIKEMHFKCSFIHPTVMFRREVLDFVGYYPENYLHAEDYAYFWKILQKAKGEIIPEILVDINVSKGNVSSANYREQLLVRKRIIGEFGTVKLLKIAGRVLISLRVLMPARLIRSTKFLILR